MISLSPSQSEAPFADERVFQKHMVSLQAFPLFPPPPVFPLFPSPPCLLPLYNTYTYDITTETLATQAM